VFYTFEKFRGATCVNIGFPDDGNPGVGKETVCRMCSIFSACVFGYTD